MALPEGDYVGDVAYTSVVHAHATAGDPDGALDALAMMANAGLPPNTKAFNAAINACARAKPCDNIRWDDILLIILNQALYIDLDLDLDLDLDALMH